MAAETLQSLLGRHAEVISEFRQRVEAVRREKGVPSDTVVREKTRLLEAVESRIEDARRTRDATVARLDARIKTLEERAAALKAEIDADRAALDPRGGGKPRPNIPGLGRVTGGAAKSGAAKQPPGITTIKGVGKAYADKLEGAGVRTPAEVAKMKLAALAEALGISEERAKKLQAAARKLK